MGLVEEIQSIRTAPRLLGERCEAVQCPRVAGFSSRALRINVSAVAGSALALGRLGFRGRPSSTRRKDRPQHLDEVVGGVVDVAGLCEDHGQVPVCPVQGGLELEEMSISLP